MDPTESAITVETAWGTLGEYGGQTIGVLALTADGIDAASRTMQFISELTTWEVDAGDAPGYARQTFTAAYSIVGSVGTRRGVLGFGPGQSASMDLAGAPSVAGFAFYDPTGGSDSARQIISINRVAPGAGFDGYPVTAPNGFATVAAEPRDLTTRVTSLEARTVPDAGDGTPGQVWTTDGSVGGWADAGATLTAHAFLDPATDVAGGDFTTVDVVDVDGNTLTAGIDRADVVGARVLLASGANAGLWTITVSGPCTQTPTLGGTLVEVVQIGADVRLMAGTQGDSQLDISAPATVFVPASPVVPDGLSAFVTRMGQFHPTNPIKPELHVSKYVTFDPAFPLDGSATHVGGQPIDDGQNITIVTQTPGLDPTDPGQKGGVWTLHLGSPATRANGFGALPGSEIANYDHVSYTGTRWAYMTMFRLLGNPLRRGMAPDLEADPPHSGIFAAEGVGRHYRADVIATTRTGLSLTVLEADGTTTAVDASAWTGWQAVFVIDSMELLSIEDGVLGGVEDFTYAEGTFIGQGVAGDGIGAAVEVVNGTVTTYTNGGGGGGGSVASVNGHTGTVVLTASDVGAATASDIAAAVAGFDWKASVRACSTSNIASLSGTTTVDGVSLIAGDRVLLAGQSTGSQNGIYVVAAGAWSRATDADVSAEVTAGMSVPVAEGTSNGDAVWVLTTNDPITLGSTSLAFTKIPMVQGLVPASNLSDVANPATALVNLGGVPTSRTFAGLSLAADRSVSDVLAETAPRRIVIYPAAEPPTSYSGTWTPTASSSATNGGYANSGATANDSSWTWANLLIPPGTWECRLIARKNSALGIATVTLGGSSFGTADLYDAAPTFNNQVAITGVTVSTGGFKDLVITNPTKNGSSSGYSLSIQAIILRRTGA